MDSSECMLEETLNAEAGGSGQALFRLLAASNLSVGFALLNAHGVFIAWNPGAVRMEGFAEAELLGRPYSAIFTEAEIEYGEPERRLSLARDSGPFEEEGWRTRKDGSRYWAMVTITVLQRAGQASMGYLQITRDLSERRAQIATLRTSYDQLSSMMDATSDGVLQISHDWRILYGNKRAEELITDFEIGAPFWDSFPSIIGTPIADNLIRCMEERVTVIYENHFVPTNLWFRARAYPTQEGIGLFFTDITTEKTMQNKLALEQILREKRIAALSQMAGGLAHEINNPLAIIHARASDLLMSAEGDGVLPAATVREACGSIVETSDRATRVLRALQGFAREAANDPMLPVSTEEILHRCIDLLEPRFLRHGVEFCVDLEPHLPPVVCRETQIRQIVTNLLNNALDAIEQADSAVRWVSLEASQQQGQLCIQVMDSGPGIEDQFRAHLMDPFFTAKQRGLGLGVGLSLSRTIAQEHGGSLTLVEGARKTCFRLILPLDPGLLPAFVAGNSDQVSEVVL